MWLANQAWVSHLRWRGRSWRISDIPATASFAMTANRATLTNLIASGATAISIIERDGVADLHAGTKIDPLAVAVFWPPDAHARPRLQGREKKNCRGGARCRDDAR